MRIPRWITLVAIGIAAVAIAFVATRPLGGGEPQPSFFVIGSPVTGVQVGQVAPGTAAAPGKPLVLTGLDGSPTRLADYADGPIWVIFWKTACDPCEAEEPDVAAAYAAHRADGLAIVAIDAWDSPEVVRDYLADHPVPYPVAVDTTGSFLVTYGLWGAPTHYFVDASGVITGRVFGPVTRDQIEDSLDQILGP